VVIYVPNLRFPEFRGEWHSIILRDLCSLITKGTTPKEFSKGDVNFVKIESLNGIYILKENCTTITSDIHNNELRRSILEQDDILFAIAGATVGKIGIVTNDILPANTNQALAIIRLKEKSQKDFLLFVLGSATMKKYIFQSMSVGAQPNLSLAQINNFKFNTPTLPEQTKIAALLSVITNRINTQSKIIEDYKLLKKGMMQRIFNQELRFKDEHNNFYPEWKEKRLEEVCNLIKDGSHGTHKDDNSSFCFLLSAKNIIANKVTFDSTDRKIPQKDYDSIYKNYQLLQGDILLTIVGTIGRVAIWKDTYPQIAFQRSVAILRFTKELPTFIAQLFNSDSFQKELLRKQVVSAQPGLYLGDIAKLLIKLPSIPEQQKIALALLSIDKKIELETEFLKRLKSQKQHFLQNLFI